MNALEQLLQHPVTQNIGLALLHSLWMLTAIALLTAPLLRLLRRRAAATRYTIACAALALMVIAPVAAYTYLHTQHTPSPPAVPFASTTPTAPNLTITHQPILESPLPPSETAAPTLAPESAETAITPAPPLVATTPTSSFHWTDTLPFLTAAWLLGVTLATTRLLGGWVLVQRLRSRDTAPLPGNWPNRANQLAARLGLKRPVSFLTSTRAAAPLAIGFIKPVVLVPLAVFNDLSPAQLETILTHELAHIRRHDYLINLLQCLAETLLFYHPAVWYVSSVIRTEREHCCDDLVIHHSGYRANYALALSRIAELIHQPRLTPAATSGPLAQRIRRILQPHTPISNKQSQRILLAAVLPALLIVTLVACNSQALKPKTDATNNTPSVAADDNPEPQPPTEIPLLDNLPIASHLSNPANHSFTEVHEPVTTDPITGETIVARETITTSAPSDPTPRATAGRAKPITKDKPAPAFSQRIIEIPTDRLLAGDAAVNVVIRPGDVIRVTANHQNEIESVKAAIKSIETTRQILQTHLDELSLAQTELLTQYGNNHPKVKAVQVQIETLTQQIATYQTQHQALLKTLKRYRSHASEDVEPRLPGTPGNRRQPSASSAPPITSPPSAPTPQDLIPHPTPYRLTPGDLVTVSVFELLAPGKEAVFTRRIDETGVIRLPVIGPVPATGRITQQVEKQIIEDLANTLQNPVVSVTLQEKRGNTYSVISDQPQTQSGVYSIPHPEHRLLEALAIARGIPTDAKIFIIRPKRTLGPVTQHAVSAIITQNGKTLATPRVTAPTRPIRLRLPSVPEDDPEVRSTFKLESSPIPQTTPRTIKHAPQPKPTNDSQPTPSDQPIPADPSASQSSDAKPRYEVFLPVPAETDQDPKDTFPEILYPVKPKNTQHSPDLIPC